MSKDILNNVVRKIVELPPKKLGVIYDFLEKMSGSDGEVRFINDILGTVVRKIVELPPEKLEVIHDFLEKMSGSDGEMWFTEGKRFLQKKMTWTRTRMAIAEENISRLVSGRVLLSIPDLNGQRNIFDHGKKIFPSGINPNFKNWHLDRPGRATGETRVNVYNLASKDHFKEMFNSFTSDFDFEELHFSQNQTIWFCENASFWMSKNWTLFLLKENGNRFVVRAGARSFNPRADVYHFEDDRFWLKSDYYRVVIPQP